LATNSAFENMQKTARLQTLQEVFRPRVAQIWTFVVSALFLYDVLCNQFGLPNIPKLWGVTGTLMPWWAWVVLLQLGFTYGLFEVMRRVAPQPPSALGKVDFADDFAALDGRIAQLEDLYQQLASATDSMSTATGNVSDLKRSIDLVATAVKSLVEPALAMKRLQQLEAIEIPAIYHPKLQKIMMNPDGPPEILEGDTEAARWSDTLRNLPRILAEIADDKTEELQKQLNAAAAGIRGNALYTTLKNDEHDVFGTPEIKQAWHIRKVSLEILQSYQHNQVQALRKKIPADLGAGNAYAFLEQLTTATK
jgi:hypothetical protein